MSETAASSRTTATHSTSRDRHPCRSRSPSGTVRTEPVASSTRAATSSVTSASASGRLAGSRWPASLRRLCPQPVLAVRERGCELVRRRDSGVASGSSRPSVSRRSCPRARRPAGRRRPPPAPCPGRSSNRCTLPSDSLGSIDLTPGALDRSGPVQTRPGRKSPPARGPRPRASGRRPGAARTPRRRWTASPRRRRRGSSWAAGGAGWVAPSGPSALGSTDPAIAIAATVATAPAPRAVRLRRVRRSPRARTCGG